MTTENTPKQGAEPVAFVNLERWLSGEAWPDDCFSEVAIDDQKTPLYTAPPSGIAAGMEMPAEFLQWIEREIPPGTVISNPQWWARKMWKAAIRAAIPQSGEFVAVPLDDARHVVNTHHIIRNCICTKCESTRTAMLAAATKGWK